MSECGRYAKAMLTGDLSTCISIEREHDLIGYPPEIVSVALNAIDRGQSPWPAIEFYLYGSKA